jgi:hypothetical protein
MSSFFCTKVFCAAFMYLQFGFEIFWQMDFGAKAAHKMFVKLIPNGSSQISLCLAPWQAFIAWGQCCKIPYFF